MPLPLHRFASPVNSGTLANGMLHTDFAPTRDTSVGNGSSFTYKDCRLEFPPSEITRGKIATYYPSVFGEVVSVMENNNGFTVKLTRPRGAKGHVADSYDMQLGNLQGILASEVTHDSDLFESWFGAKGVLQPVDACFTINVFRNTTDWIIGEDINAGTLLGLWVNIHRLDEYVNHQIQKTYSLEADFFTPLV
ncbi:hypothetical protein B0H13DRAFT_2660610, partial [Mycena leptocephala]